jgi:alpha-beta hydrolase superfamily lysophospholipase
MSRQMDLSFLDRPEVLQIIFPVAYSPFFLVGYPPSSAINAPTYPVEVERGVRVVCGFWVSGQDCPTILYFHGNGETVPNHDWIAPLYNERGINLFVADYRGYGASNGQPTISNTLTDAHAIFQGFQEIIKKEGFKNSLFVMGRSVGSVPAVELAFTYQDELRGLIVESGASNNFRRLWHYLGIATEDALMDEGHPFLNKVKIRQVRKPTLIIHGEYDQIISVTEGQELYVNSGAQDKELLIIPGADHNDILMVGPRRYFDAIEKFVTKYG